MAGNSIRVNTDQVAQIASNLEGLNKKLTEELTNSKATVDQLANIWEGEAAQATISSFDDNFSKFLAIEYPLALCILSSPCPRRTIDA